MSKPSESDIAKRAYNLWEQEGRPHGRDKEHWHAAEHEILGAATTKEDRPAGEARSVEQASERPASTPPSDRQTGAAAPGRPAQPASPGMTQAAAATPKRAPQVQGEQQPQAQAAQPAGAKPQQSSKTTPASPSSARRPRSGSKQSSS